jgi:hypothetical protein
MEKNTGESKLIEKRKLTLEEQGTVDHLKQKKGAARAVSLFKVTETSTDQSVAPNIDTTLAFKDAVELFRANLLEVTGISDSDVGVKFFTSLLSAILPIKASREEAANLLNIMAATLQAFQPKDEYEAQLVSQMVVLHEHAMDWLGRAKRTERVDFANIYLNGASKLLTRHHETLEALLKYRRGGEQRVHVEHVHVHSGGQAIVGNVIPRGGLPPKIEEGPHAKV